jgi:4a-hydroxytetrahydrobiopterin dehydratase
MKPSSRPRKPISRVAARNAALVNQFATPGLGSLMGRRWISGACQLLLALTGCVMLLVWFFKVIIRYYGLMFDEEHPNPAGWVGEWGGILLAVSWFWALVTSFSLFREVSATGLQSLESFAAGQLKLDTVRIPIALATVPAWKRQGDAITRTFEFKDFFAAIKFVNAVAELAEQAWHHPDIDIRWNKVTLTLTTHKAGGLTEMDFALAQKADRLQIAKGWNTS